MLNFYPLNYLVDGDKSCDVSGCIRKAAFRCPVGGMNTINYFFCAVHYNAIKNEGLSVHIRNGPQIFPYPQLSPFHDAIVAAIKFRNHLEEV